MTAKQRPVALEIYATDLYCDNSCEGMSIDARRCEYFGQDLSWNPRKKTHGNARLEVCKQAEARVR